MTFFQLEEKRIVNNKRNMRKKNEVKDKVFVPDRQYWHKVGQDE